MRRLMFIFGLLDLGIVATYAPRVPAYFHDLGSQPFLSIACLTVMASLVVSGYGLLRGRTWAMILNYVQFPFRVALAFLSLTLLAQLLAPIGAPVQFHEVVWVSAVGVEGIRLGLTIMLQARGPRQQHNHPLLWQAGISCLAGYFQTSIRHRPPRGGRPWPASGMCHLIKVDASLTQVEEKGSFLNNY
jgi:hypothetical protein